MRFCLDAKRSWVGDPIWLCQAGEGLHQALSKKHLNWIAVSAKQFRSAATYLFTIQTVSIPVTSSVDIRRPSVWMGEKGSFKTRPRNSNASGEREPVVRSGVQRAMRWFTLAICFSFGCTSGASSPPLHAPQTHTPQTPAPQEEAPRTIVTGAWQDLGRFGDAHHRECAVRAWVPSHAEGARLPMLIVLDGHGVSEWFRVESTIAELATEGLIEPWIVLAIESASDRNEVLARADGELARFIEREILPAARAGLPWREGRASTAIFGYSYGGLSAVASVIAEPDVFGRAIAMSPSLWVGGRAIMPRFERARRLPDRLWIDVGSAEPDEGQLIPYMVSDARNLRDLALHRGMTFGLDVGYLEAMGEGHDMRAGGRRMREALLFALSAIDLRVAAVSALRVTRYPAPTTPNARNSTFAVEVGYAIGARLTWPESLVDVHAGQTRIQRDIVPLRSRLRVDAFGLRAETD